MSNDRHLKSSLASLGSAIQAVRRERGRTIGDLAEEAGISDREIVELEAGRVDPSYELLLALADELSVPVSEFLCRVDELQSHEAVEASSDWSVRDHCA